MPAGQPVKPTQAQIDAEAGVRKEILERRAKYEPYIGKKFKAKTPEPRPQEYTIMLFHPAMPFSGKGALPAFQVSRSPLPGSWFADAEEFLANHEEIVDGNGQ